MAWKIFANIKRCVRFNGNDTLKLEDISVIQKFFPNKFAIEIYSEEALTCNLRERCHGYVEATGDRRCLPSIICN